MSTEPDLLRPAAVAFDLDGLMFNTETLYEHVGRLMIERRGKVYSPELTQRMMGRPSRVALRLMIEHHDLSDSIHQLEEETDSLFNDILEDRLETMPGLLALLDALERATIPKAVTTSSRRPFVERVLGQFELQSRFEFILSAEDVVNGKPAPEIYQAAAGRFRIPTSHLLVLEDSEIGSRAAVAAQAMTIAVPGAHSKHHHFPPQARVADSLADPMIFQTLGIGI